MFGNKKLEDAKITAYNYGLDDGRRCGIEQGKREIIEQIRDGNYVVYGSLGVAASANLPIDDVDEVIAELGETRE